MFDDDYDDYEVTTRTARAKLAVKKDFLCHLFYYQIAHFME